MDGRKSWDELLWLYLTGNLSTADKQTFEQYLSENEGRRAEVAQWDQLSAAVYAEADSRVEKLPPLSQSFMAKLDHEPPKASLNGSHPKPIMEIKKSMIAVSNPPKKQDLSLTMTAAIIAVMLFAALFLYNSLPPEDRPGFAGPSAEDLTSATPLPSFVPSLVPTASGMVNGTVMAVNAVSMYDGPGTTFNIISAVASHTPVQIMGQNIDGTWYTVQLPDGIQGWLPANVVVFQMMPPGTSTFAPATATPVPSVTFTPTPIPMLPNPSTAPTVMSAMPDIRPSATPLPIQPSMIPLLDPRASITPSQIEPIISDPASLRIELQLPDGDFGRYLDWSKDGSKIAVAGSTGIWINNTRVIYRLEESASTNMLDVAFNDDGTLLASIDWDRNLQIWDLRSNLLIAELANAPVWANMEFVGDMIYSPDSRSSVILTEDNRLIIQELPLSAVSANILLQTISADASLTAAYSVDGLHIVDYPDGTLRNTIDLSRYIAFEVRYMAFSDDASRLVVVYQDSTALVVDIETGSIISEAMFTGFGTAATFLDDNTVIASSFDYPIYNLWYWNLETGRKNTIITYNVGLSQAAVYGNAITTITDDGKLLILDIEQ